MTALGLVAVLSTVAYLVWGEIRRAARTEAPPPAEWNTIVPLAWLGAGVVLLFAPRLLELVI